MVQYVFPLSELGSYNVVVTPSPTLDILDSSSPLVGAPLMCFSIHHQDSHEMDSSFSTQQQSQQSKHFTSQSGRPLVPSNRFGDYHVGLIKLQESTSYQQVALSVNRRIAMDDKIKSIYNNDVWQLIDLPPSQ